MHARPSEPQRSGERGRPEPVPRPGDHGPGDRDRLGPGRKPNSFRWTEDVADAIAASIGGWKFGLDAEVHRVRRALLERERQSGALDAARREPLGMGTEARRRGTVWDVQG